MERSVGSPWPRRLRLVAYVLALAPMLPATAAATETVTFDTLSSGTFLTNQLGPSQGVRFPRGLNVQANPLARSAPNLAVPPLNGEFARHDVIAEFTFDQTEVSIAVQANAELGSVTRVTLNAYDIMGVLVDTATRSFIADTTWRTLTVGSAASGFAIHRVVLNGGATSHATPTNFLQVDDLVYSTFSELPPDTLPPTMSIWEPPFPEVELNARVVRVRISAVDNVELQSIRGTIVHTGLGREVGRLDFCGSATAGPCPATTFAGTINAALDPATDGPHEVAVTACDASGNCVTLRRGFTLRLPPPPAAGFVQRVEINQGVQPSLFSIGPAGDTRFPSSPVYLLAGRDTAVRFYPLAVDRARPGYSARLTARIRYRDGTTVDRFAIPNAGVPTVDVAADPVLPVARENVYVLMRADRAKTLNYVIPAAVLRNAVSLEVRLEAGAPLTGWVQVGLNREVRLVVKHLRLIGRGIPAGTRPTPDQLANSFRYVEETFPISELDVVESPTTNVTESGLCEIFRDDLDCAVWQFSFHHPPGAIPRSGLPTHLMKVGYAPYDSFPRTGIALWGSAIAMAYGDDGYSHEIAHTAGRPHAGGFHGEVGGEAWPFPHGQVGPTDFGVVTELVTEPGSFDLGRWELTVVDPCPGATVPERTPSCALPDDQATHDIMSYGRGAADVGSLGTISRSNNWISQYTWNRLYEKFRSSGVIRSRAAATGAGAASAATSSGSGGEAQDSSSHAEALLIDAVIRGSGALQPLPVLRLSVPREELEAPPAGPYTLEMYGPSGQLLFSRRFDVGEMHDAGAERLFMLGQVVPYQPDVRRIVVRKDGKEVLDRHASGHAPTVEIHYPNGGEVLESGVVTLSWTVDDADGDRVLSRVEYSSDGGETWGSLGMVGSGEPTQLDVDVSELPKSAVGLFRVTASDGFLTASDASDCPIAVGVPKPADCEHQPLNTQIREQPTMP